MEPQDPSGKPKRRVRYKGTHPRHFHEKYKELQPERYKEDVNRVMARGQTPAGMHRPIMVEEILAFLKPETASGPGWDATLGYGGHTRAILERLAPGVCWFATDVDPIELPKTEQRLREAGFGEDRLQIRRMNFSGLEKLAAETGPLHLILADLGVSSMQLDDPSRGFSYKVEGPLDLRLNPARGKPASALLKDATREELEKMFQDHSDEPYARPIAAAITARIAAGRPVETTLELASAIAAGLDRLPERQKADAIKSACQRCFQALRIEVNDEFGVLDRFLEKLPDVLAPGGRVAVLTFHSGEDRRVKKAFQEGFRSGLYSAVASEPARPTAAEAGSNPRSRPAKLRWAVRSEG